MTTKAGKATAGELLKMTFRLTPAAVAALERERTRRIEAGAKRQDADRGDVVSEALLIAFGKGRHK